MAKFQTGDIIEDGAGNQYEILEWDFNKGRAVPGDHTPIDYLVECIKGRLPGERRSVRAQLAEATCKKVEK